ncbi:MAG: hypothetical protein ACREX3_11280 [Gammaproteobacteria bacterium]
MSILLGSSALLVALVASSEISLGDATDDLNGSCTPANGKASTCHECLWKRENCHACISELEQRNDTSRDCRFTLAQALSNLAVIVGPSKERRDIYKKKNQVYEGLLADFPNDPEILREYAMTHEDETAIIPLLKKLLTLTPDDRGAHRILGLLLTDSTNDAEIREGLLHYAHAYEVAAAHRKVGSGSQYMLALRQHGYEDRAAQFLRRMLDDFRVDTLFLQASRLLGSDTSRPPPFPNALTQLTDIVCHIQFLLVDRSRCDSVLKLTVQLQQMYPDNIALASLMVTVHERIILGTRGTAPDIDETSIRRAYELAVLDEPDNLSLLRAYGSHLEESEREEVLSQHINTYSATPAATQAELAELYWGNSEREAAIQHMYRAFRHDAAVNRDQYGERLSTMLREVGRPTEAAAVESQLRPAAMD